MENELESEKELEGLKQELAGTYLQGFNALRVNKECEEKARKIMEKLKNLIGVEAAHKLREELYNKAEQDVSLKIRETEL